MEHNLEGKDNVVINRSDGYISYAIGREQAIRYEPMAPELFTMAPYVEFALTDFELEGSRARASNWEELGSWYYNNLIKLQIRLSTEVISEVRSLVSDAGSDREKARRIYEYVQQRSRYISVQLGIGGRKPIRAQEVHEKGYGDCKGLTNYMMALM